jgi:glycosyltransferase involved in cell wall biosynthesis
VIRGSVGSSGRVAAGVAGEAASAHPSTTGRPQATHRHTMPPLVSVVIPTYGHADYVVDAVESVFGQGYAPIEVIVVNDGSPDDTEARLAPLVASGRIRYVRQANSGVAAARNHGASLARGAYLAFLDDDDLWPADSLAVRVATLEADSSVELVAGSHVPFHDIPPSPAGAAAPAMEPSRFDWLSFFAGNLIVSPGQVLLRRSAFERVGGFTARIWGADDWDLWLRILRDSAGCCIRHPTLYYRLHGSNNSRDAARLLDASLAVVRHHLRDVPAQHRTVVGHIGLMNIASHWRPLVRAQLREKWRQRAWRAAAKAGRVEVRAMRLEWTARCAVKARLMSRGRWRLDPNTPLIARLLGDGRHLHATGEVPSTESATQSPQSGALVSAWR